MRAGEPRRAGKISPIAKGAGAMKLGSWSPVYHWRAVPYTARGPRELVCHLRELRANSLRWWLTMMNRLYDYMMMMGLLSYPSRRSLHCFGSRVLAHEFGRLGNRRVQQHMHIVPM